MAKIHNLNGGHQPQVNIKPEDLQDVNCDNCGKDLFLPSMMFKKISKLLTGTPEDQIVPAEVFVCATCGTILKDVLPKGFRVDDDGEE